MYVFLSPCSFDSWCVHVMCVDVAEENISPIKTIDFTDVNGILGSHRSFGRWFDGVELYPSGRTRFIQSKESKLIFPDDEAVALSFIDITTPPE